MTHPRSECKHALVGSRESLVICAIDKCLSNSHVGMCKRCPDYDGPSRGLGDTVERFTRITGIKAATESVAKMLNKDCGCGKRRNNLNEAIPYSDK